MNSRERITKALNHEESDRVPIDVGGLCMSSMHVKVYMQLLERLGLEEDIEITDIFQRTVRVSQAVNERFHGDTWLVGPAWKPWEKVKENYYIDEWKIKYYDAPDAHYWHMHEHPLSGATIDDVKNYQFPDPHDPQKIEGLVEYTKKIYEETDYALIFGGFGFKGDFWDMPSRLMSHEHFYISLLMDEKMIEALLERFLEYWTTLAENSLKPIAPYVSGIMINDDMGGQNGPLMSPETYRKLIKPYQTAFYAKLKEIAPNAKLILHSCGSVYKFLDDWIEMGVDALNPIQLTAKHMGDTKKLKDEFGDRLTFWGGGCDTHDVLPKGTRDEIRAEVKSRIQDMAPGGGYVFTQVHNIQPDVSAENVETLYDAAYEFGQYPIS